MFPRLVSQLEGLDLTTDSAQKLASLLTPPEDDERVIGRLNDMQIRMLHLRSQTLNKYSEAIKLLEQRHEEHATSHRLGLCTAQKCLHFQAESKRYVEKTIEPLKRKLGNLTALLMSIIELEMTENGSILESEVITIRKDYVVVLGKMDGALESCLSIIIKNIREGGNED